MFLLYLIKFQVFYCQMHRTTQGIADSAIIADNHSLPAGLKGFNMPSVARMATIYSEVMSAWYATYALL